MWLPLLTETFHQMGVVPVLVAGVRRVRVLRLWLIAAALAVSWLADWAAHVRTVTWPVAAIYPVLQFGLVAYALLSVPRALWRIGLVGGVAVLALSSAPISLPTAALTLCIGVIVWWDAEHRTTGALRHGLFVYFGLGALAYALFPLFMDRPTAFLWAWLGYQGCRVVGISLVTYALWRGHGREAPWPVS